MFSVCVFSICVYLCVCVCVFLCVCVCFLSVFFCVCFSVWFLSVCVCVWNFSKEVKPVPALLQQRTSMYLFINDFVGFV